MIVFEDINGRPSISLAVPKKQQDFFKSFVLELISEVVVMDYKYEYLKSHLSCPIASEVIWTSFLKSLTVFDKQTDKDLIKKNLHIDDEILIDSAYNFSLWTLRDRWREIASLVRENLNGLVSRDSLIELMRFLIYASDMEADTVFVKNCKNDTFVMINESKIAKNLCFFEENANRDMRVLSELVCLCPREIVLELDSEKDQNLIENISQIFGEKVHIDYSSNLGKYSDKIVDKKGGVVYNKL